MANPFIDFNSAFQDIFVYIVTAGIGAVLIYLKTMRGCLDKLQDRTIRQSKCLVDIADDRDEKIKKLHPEKADSCTPLKPRIERNLKDDKGNF